MKVTLKDIAAKSGYSISTVSRVLNGSQIIGLDTQKQILRIAEELNYPFSKSKIPLYSGGAHHIALITDFHEGEFYSSYFHGFSKAARESDIQLSLIDIPDYQELRKTVENLDEHHYDGICLFLPELDKDDYQEILEDYKSDLPVVSNAMIQSPVVPTITFDGYSGGHLAAEHFLKMGCSSFGIIKGPFEKAESRFRYNGFKDHLEHSGHTLSWEFNGDYTFRSGIKAFQDYLGQVNRPECIFSANDQMGKGFMEAAKLEGIQIPKEVALITYDNLPLCSDSFPSITAINTDFMELGKATFKVLKDMIGNKHSRNGTLSLIPVSMIKRETA